MMNNLIKKTILGLIIISIFIPILSFAAPAKLDYSGLVKCDGVVDKNNPDEAARNKVCDFNALMGMVKSTINWLFVITIPISVAFIAYGGLLYMTGNPKNINTAHSIFISIGKGFIIMLIAWFVVITVVNWFISKEFQDTVNTFVNTGK